jgi:hypothetical protein
MSKRGHGQIRRGQLITTYGPGALIDLPKHSAIVGGLETWPQVSKLEQILEPRLTRKLQIMTGVVAPNLYAPPAEDSSPGAKPIGIGAYRFPEWFVVQESSKAEGLGRSRRLVHRKHLDDRGRFEGLPVVATRFVQACPLGHVDDIEWHRFVHGDHEACRRQLWLDERGTSGDLSDLTIRCECKKSRPMSDAVKIEEKPLGTCSGERPWLGRHAREDCTQPGRLLIRTASNAYFAQALSVLSLPDRGSAVETAVADIWDELQYVDNSADLAYAKKKPKVLDKLSVFQDEEVMKVITTMKNGKADEKPVKQVELDAILAAPEGFGDDMPVDRDFHARRLPEKVWRKTKLSDPIEAIYQLHRLREVMALVGFTRFEAETTDINGEYDTDVKRADIAQEPKWFPAVENRGEGIFLKLRADAISVWLTRPAAKARVEALEAGHEHWSKDRKVKRPFPGGPYILLHTLSHLLLQSLAMRCGYPASSIRERIYSDSAGGRFGLLLYTGSPDADGTLGGLVQEARHLEDHLAYAFRLGALCSNDPICAHHSPGKSIEGRWLHGAACHGCALVAEPSCEMRNDYLDRGLVVPILGEPNAALFGAVT